MAKLDSTTIYGSLFTTSNTTSKSFIKIGGTADDVLLGDGTTASLAGLGGGGTYTSSNGILLTGSNFTPTYGTAANTIAQGNDSRINNGQTAFGWGNHAGLYSTTGHTHSYLPLSGGTLTGPLTLGGILTNTDTPSKDKLRVWTSNIYTIGMTSGLSFGGLVSDYAMTFQMNSSDTRGFWWGDEAHSTSQGAMSLTTNGKLTVAYGMRVGYGEADTTVPGATYRVDVSGSISATKFVQGSLRSLKKNIEPFNKSGLGLISGLSIVKYDLKDGNADNVIGIIADDSPGELLTEKKDAVDLYKTIFVQAKAIQELNTKLESQEERIQKLEDLVNKLTNG